MSRKTRLVLAAGTLVLAGAGLSAAFVLAPASVRPATGCAAAAAGPPDPLGQRIEADERALHDLARMLRERANPPKPPNPPNAAPSPEIAPASAETAPSRKEPCK